MASASVERRRAAKAEALAHVRRLAYRPEEFAAAVGLPLTSIRSWLAEYVDTNGRSGLPHTRPMPHTILIWADELPRWRSRHDAVRVAGKSISGRKISGIGNPGGMDRDTDLDAGPTDSDEIDPLAGVIFE